jgi:Protein of unknown function (DUF3833)
MRRSALVAAFGLMLTVWPVAGQSEKVHSPLKFFEGRTVGQSIVKITMRKAFSSRTIGNGQIASDGTLHLVQQVEEDGRKRFQRIWRVKQVAPGRFTGTMSEAVGPVSVDEVGNRYRFRFRLKGGVSVEQWLTPLPDGMSAKSEMTVRKFGMIVGRSSGTIKRATRLTAGSSVPLH